MRIAFLSSEYPPHTYGGLGTTVEALSRHLGAAGHQVVILVPDGDYADPPPGVRLRMVSVREATSDEDFWLAYCEAVESVDADIVHAHDWMTALGGVALGRRQGIPVLFSVHLPQAGGTNLLLEEFGISGSDAVLVNSEDVRTELKGRGAKADVHVIPNGVDLTQYTPGGSPDPNTVLFVGRLVPQKGVGVLLRALPPLLRRHPEARLVLVGDGQERLYLERVARRLGIAGKVEFAGWQSAGQLAVHYRSAAVTAVPSRYEPFGLVALEAMASGRPVVVSRVGGLTEIVDDPAYGFTVEPDDHLGLAGRLAQLIGDPPLARTMGLSARRRAEQFDWARIAGRTAELYASLTVQRTDVSLPDTDPDLSRRVAAVLERSHGC